MSTVALSVQRTTRAPGSSSYSLGDPWNNSKFPTFDDSGKATLHIPLRKRVKPKWLPGYELEAMTIAPVSHDGAFDTDEGRPEVNIYFNKKNEGRVVTGSGATVKGLVFELAKTE